MPVKKAYNITGSGAVLDSQGLYYGFVCVAGGVARRVEAWDNPTAPAGIKVEDYTTGTVTGEHNHVEPVYLISGLYVGFDGPTGIIYAWEDPLH